MRGQSPDFLLALLLHYILAGLTEDKDKYQKSGFTYRERNSSKRL